MAATGASRPVQPRHLERRLVHQHAQTAQGGGTGRGGGGQPVGDRRVVDEVGRHLPRPQLSGVDRRRHLGGAPHARRCGVDHQVHPPRLVGRPDPPDRTGQGGGPGRPVGTAVDHHHLGRTGLGQCQHHRPAGTPGPRHQAPSTRRVEAGAPGQRGHEARTVGVVAEQPAVPPHHAVHRLQATRHLGALVDQPGHRGLVGHGHRAADHPQRPQPGNRRRRCARRHEESDRHPVEAEGGERHVVQPR